MKRKQAIGTQLKPFLALQANNSTYLKRSRNSSKSSPDPPDMAITIQRQNSITSEHHKRPYERHHQMPSGSPIGILVDTPKPGLEDNIEVSLERVEQASKRSLRHGRQPSWSRRRRLHHGLIGFLRKANFRHATNKNRKKLKTQKPVSFLKVPKSDQEDQRNATISNRVENRTVIVGNDRLVSVKRKVGLISPHFLLEKDEGNNSSLKQIPVKHPKHLTKCIYQARLESDPNARVSLTGCLGDGSMDALVVSRASDLHHVDPLSGTKVKVLGGGIHFGSKNNPIAPIQMERDEVKPPTRDFGQISSNEDEITSSEDFASNKLQAYRNGGGLLEMALQELVPSNLGLDKIFLFLEPEPVSLDKKVFFGVQLRKEEGQGYKKMFSLVERDQSLKSAYDLALKSFRDRKQEQKKNKGSSHYLLRESQRSGTGNSTSYPPKVEDQPERTIEVQLYTDKAFYEQMKIEHPDLGQGQDLSFQIVKDLLIILSGAEALLQHPSLGVAFNLRLTKVRILSGAGPSPEGEILLDLLAEFQKYLEESPKTHTDKHPLYADIHVLLTGKDYKTTAGYAYTGTMCTLPAYCVAVLKHFSPQNHQGTDQSTLRGAMANLLAHEIAHTLGMPHDGEDNECSSDPNTNNIMTPVVATSAKVWSECSREAALRFVAQEDDFCLFH